ncbi:MAG: TrkH family potassium uptake protein [Actinomycetota bacterium]
MPTHRGARAEMLHPARVIVLAFATVIAVGTVLLSLPLAIRGDGTLDVLTALFTATSAVCVTGLTVVDTTTYWSGFGHTVILALIQIGGLGITAFGAILVYTISSRVGIRTRMAAQTETQTAAGDLRTLLKRVVVFVAGTEAILAAVLAARFWWSADEPALRAAWLGIFHAVSAFNNAGFALFPDNLVPFATDLWITAPIMIGIILGGIGIPVVTELRRNVRRPGRWSVHTKLTVLTSVVLLASGFVVILALEWSNTLGAFGAFDKAAAALFQSVSPRTAGFNTVDYSRMHESTWFFTSILMFIGAGSASTAGGIKVSTFALLAFVLWSELRTTGEVTAFRRRMPAETQRQAVTVALLSVALVVAATMVLITFDDFALIRVLFEVCSAFGLVGLTTGITARMDGIGQLILIALMFVGRIGPATLGVALVLRERPTRVRFAEDRPLIG